MLAFRIPIKLLQFECNNFYNFLKYISFALFTFNTNHILLFSIKWFFFCYFFWYFSWFSCFYEGKVISCLEILFIFFLISFFFCYLFSSFYILSVILFYHFLLPFLQKLYSFLWFSLEFFHLYVFVLFFVFFWHLSNVILYSWEGFCFVFILWSLFILNNFIAFYIRLFVIYAYMLVNNEMCSW